MTQLSRLFLLGVFQLSIATPLPAVAEDAALLDAIRKKIEGSKGQARSATSNDRGHLAGLLSAHLIECIKIEGEVPKEQPIVAFSLNLDGSFAEKPRIANPSKDQAFSSYSAKLMSALMKCEPFKIPDRFHPTHSEWKNIRMSVHADDFKQSPEASTRWMKR